MEALSIVSGACGRRVQVFLDLPKHAVRLEILPPGEEIPAQPVALGSTGIRQSPQPVREGFARRGICVLLPRPAGFIGVAMETQGHFVRIVDLAEMILRLTGFDGKLIWDSDKPNGQPRRGLDVTRAKEYFGWEAKVPFEEGMRRTIEWYKENRKHVPAKDDLCQAG